ncbi:hypothetical protein GSU75_05914 [Pseudomonas savastanoi pv. phaseolicola]|nr:hypothetical protein [Pseudomonas savastanoi pv. phaseolicola]
MADPCSPSADRSLTSSSSLAALPRNRRYLRSPGQGSNPWIDPSCGWWPQARARHPHVEDATIFQSLVNKVVRVPVGFYSVGKSVGYFIPQGAKPSHTTPLLLENTKPPGDQGSKSEARVLLLDASGLLYLIHRNKVWAVRYADCTGKEPRMAKKKTPVCASLLPDRAHTGVDEAELLGERIARYGQAHTRSLLMLDHLRMLPRQRPQKQPRALPRVAITCTSGVLHRG